MKLFKVLTILIFFSACNASISNGMSEEGIFVGMPDVAMNEPSSFKIASDSMGSQSLSPREYIIKSAYGSMDVSTSNFDQKVNEFKNLISEYEGNISDTYLSTNYQGLKIQSITTNIPAENFDQFLIEVEDIKDFSDISINANDVTTYVLDIDSRLSSLANEKEALEEIKLEAKTTSERLEVQNQLRYVNQDIEMLKGQKEYYANAISYSKLSLNIREGAGISLFSWNYYFQRSLNWIESIVGYAFSLGIIALPFLLIFFFIKKIKNKE
jgi:hypothetical protein